MGACGLFSLALGALVACGGSSPNQGTGQTMGSVASTGCAGSDQNTGLNTGPESAASNAGSDQSSGSSGSTSHSTSSSKSQSVSSGTAGIVAGSATNNTISVNGTTRTYVLYTPSTYDGKTPLPLIFAFHGDGGTGESLREWFNLEPTVNEQAIIVYPDGLDPNQAWDDNDSHAGLLEGLMADVNFVDAVVDALSTNGCVATNRLYATGISRGAYFTNQMVCRSSNTWRAIVTHSGGGPYNVPSDGDNFTCKNEPLAALQVQGDADNVVDPSEGYKASNFWCNANSCTGCPKGGSYSTNQPTPSVSYDPSPCMTYNGCQQPEVWCLIPGLTHTFWDQAASVTWGFFSQQQ